MTAETQSLKRRRRRWHQFSLRTLLLVVVPLACVVAWVNREITTASRQREAIEWVSAAGGRVEFDHHSPKNWRRYVLGEHFPGVVRAVDLDLGPTIVGFHGGMGGFQEILHFSEVDNLAPLASLTDTRELHLIGWEKGDLAPLGNLHQLESLTLNNSQVSDLGPLANLEQLERLFLRDTLAEDLTPLAELPNLRELNLRGCPVRDFAPLAEIPTLEWLCIDADRHTDLAPLYELRQLKYLGICDPPGREERITLAQLAALRQALPQCEVVAYAAGKLDRSPTRE